MIIKKFFNPQLTIALSFLAASGCFAATPSYYHEDDKNSHALEESHKNISLRKQNVALTETKKVKANANEPLPASKGPRAEEYKKRLAAIRESYNAIALNVQDDKAPVVKVPAEKQSQEAVDAKKDEFIFDQLNELENPEESCKRPNPGAETEKRLEDMTNQQAISKGDQRRRDLVALSSPYGEEEEIEEERDWGNDTQGAEDMMPSDFDALDRDTSIEENAPGDDPLNEDEFDEGRLSRRSTDPDIDQVAQVQGRREQSRDIRTSTQAPGMSSIDRSSISTDRVRRSRTPKTSLQSQRQKEATNNLRTRFAKVTQANENGGQFEYYEDYLASISGEPVVEDDKSGLAPERKRYTKQRRRPVSPDNVKKDETAMNDQVVTSKKRKVKRNKFNQMEQDSQTIDNQSNFGNSRTSNQVIRPAPSAPVDQARPKKIRQKKLVDNETTEKTNNVARRVVAKRSSNDVSPRPVVITASMIKKPSVEKPAFQNAPKTYVADMTSPGASDDNDEDYDDEDEEDGDEGEEGALTTDRSERPNWYERMTDQRHERSVQARVRAADQGQPAQDRGYPTIPQYTSGNTTPRAR